MGYNEKESDIRQQIIKLIKEYSGLDDYSGLDGKRNKDFRKNYLYLVKQLKELKRK